MWKCSVTCYFITKMSTYFKYCKINYLIYTPYQKKSLLSNRCPLAILSLYYMPLSNRCPPPPTPHDNYLIQCTSGPGPALPHPHPWALNDLDHVAINFSDMYYEFVTIKFSYFFFPMGKYQIGNINFTKTCIYSFFSFCRYWFWFGYSSVKLTS